MRGSAQLSQRIRRPGQLIAGMFLMILLAGCITPTVIAPTLPPAPTATTAPTAAPPEATRTPIPPSPTPVLQLGPFRLVASAETLLPGLLNGLYLPADGALWLSSDRGVARIFANERQVYLTRFWDQVVGADDTGQIWVISASGGQISSWDGFSWLHYGAEEGWLPLAEHPLRDRVQPGLFTDSNGRLWLLTAWDVRRFDGKRWVVSTPSTTGLPLPWRKSVTTTLAFTVVPGTDTAWLGGCNWENGKPIGGGGLRYFNGRYWEDGGLPDDNICISALTANAGGDVWAGGIGEVWQYSAQSETWQQQAAPALDDTQMTWSVVLDLPVAANGTVWPRLALCGEAGCDLLAQRYRLADGQWTALTEISPVEDEHVLFDADGAAWRLTRQAVYALEPGASNPAAEMKIVTAAAGPDGRLWLVGGIGDGNSIWATP